VREVLLHAQQQPLILARTVIPWQTVQYLPYNLTRLGTRPLGEIIFADPKIERSTLELAYIVPALWTTEARLLGQINAAVWGRRTLYLAWQQPLLVTECFLPAVL
jgi:chorismate--pyruvate lyase